MTLDQSILIAGLLLAFAIATTLVARRARVPGLVLFLILGMLVGPEGLDIVGDVDAEMAQAVGIIAVSLIIFEGGLSMGWREIRPVLGVSLSLAVIGTILTAVVTGLLAAWVLDFSTTQAMLVGSIIASTDGAAVFALLRNSTLKKRLARTLEAEAGLNDPVAIFLVVGLMTWIELPDYGLSGMVALFAEQMLIGGIAGAAVGYLAVRGIRAVGSITTGLYPVATVATAASAFGVAQVFGGSGFLATFIAGLMLGSARLPARRMIADFHDGVAWVCQIAMFMVLGLLFDIGSIDDLWLQAAFVTFVLMFVARPIAVTVATAFSSFNWRETVLLQWAGLRGAVPIVLATFPLHANFADSNAIFNIVLFVVLASATIQGTTFEWAASRLGLTTTQRAVVPPVFQAGNIRKLGAEFFEFHIHPGDALAGHVVSELQLPREALVSLIVRGEEALLPRGSTQLEVQDRLQILVRGSVVGNVEELFKLWREGPIGVLSTAKAQTFAARNAIFSVKPWAICGEGDESDPYSVRGVLITKRLRMRHDEKGVLFQLIDGRYGVTSGGVCATGSSRQLHGYAVRRIEHSETVAERAWWQEVAGATA